MEDQAPESRIEPIGAKVTPSEKRAIRAVAEEEKKDVSNLLREYSITDLVQKGRQLTGEAA